MGENLSNYTGFPRVRLLQELHLIKLLCVAQLVGECGGKNYHFVHPTADVASVVASSIRSAFEYQGQKCSACSRMYVPESLWTDVKEGLVQTQKSLKVGPATEADSFMSAVIDKKAFDRISGYIEHAKASPNCSIVAGGGYDESVGYFIEPTIVQTTSPTDKIFQEEIFGPVVTVYVYPDKVRHCQYLSPLTCLCPGLLEHSPGHSEPLSLRPHWSSLLSGPVSLG